MRKRVRFVMAAAFALSVGTVWAGETVEIDGAAANPTVIGGDIAYEGGAWFWTSANAGGAPGYATLDNLEVRDAELTIGADGADPALNDIVVNFAEGDGVGSIIVDDAAGTGRAITIGADDGVKGVSVYATDLKVIEGVVVIASSPAMEDSSANLLSLDTLTLDNTFAETVLAMLGDAAQLHVAGVTCVGGAVPAAGTDPKYFAELVVAGEGAWFGGGIVLENGGMFGIVDDSGPASVVVGNYDGVAYSAGDIVMTGGAFIYGGDAASDDVLVILDKSASDDPLGGVPLSSLVIQGDSDNEIAGIVDASPLKEMLVDGRLSIDYGNRLFVRDYRQISGVVQADGELVITGTSATVTGGAVGYNITFTNPKLESFDFEGTGLDIWPSTVDHQIAQLGDDTTVTGVAGAGQTINFGKFAGMGLGWDEFIDIGVAVSRESYIAAEMVPDGVSVISATLDSDPAEFFVESGDSFRFWYGRICKSGLAGEYDDVAANPLLLVVAGDNATLDIPDFSFNGMFGYYGFASSPDRNRFGLVDYAPGGVAFDGARADADYAYGTLVPVYGDTVTRGLSDMAYRMGMYVFDTPYDPDGDLPTLQYITYDRDSPDFVSAMLNRVNLLDIAAGRAKASTIALYNGSNIFGVNQVSASTALAHARIGMRRSDEIRHIDNLVRNSVSAGDAYASAIMNQCYVNRFWAGGFGLWEDAGAYRGFEGYKYKSAGVAVGYDRMFGPNVIVGGSFAATLGEYEDKSALAHDSDIDSYSFNLYATYTHQSGFFASLFGGYTYSDNDIRELRLSNLTDTLWDTADYRTNSWLAGGKLGYDVKPNDRFTITPSVGLTWIGARSSAHTEYFGEGSAVKVSRMRTNQTYLPVELGFGYDFLFGGSSRLNLALNLGYAYNFNNDQIKGDVWLPGFIDPAPYAAVSRVPGHHTYTVGGALRYTVGRFDIGAKYDYARKAKMDSHRLYGTVGISF